MSNIRVEDLEARIEALEELVANLRQLFDPNQKYKNYFQRKLNDIYESD